MTAALQTLTKFSRLAASHKVDEILAAATTATREADNGGDFIAEVERQTGIRIRVISGTEEARLIHLAAGYGVDIGGSTAVVIDIGGGSVEVTLGTATHLTQAKSFKLGVIRLTETFVKSDPLSAHDERRLVKHINKRWAPTSTSLPRRGFERVIGTSGTILSLGALALSEDAGATPTELRNQRVRGQDHSPHRASGWPRPISTRGCTRRASIRAAPTSRSPARSCSTRSCAASAPRT